MIPKISNVKQWAKNEIIFKRKYYLIIFGGKEDLNEKTTSVNQKLVLKIFLSPRFISI